MDQEEKEWTMQSGSEPEDSFDFLFKIILIGDSNVGKTCVVQSFKTGLFSERQQNTIGVDFTVRTLNIEGKRVKVWDTAGQERFRTITQSYYRSAHGAMITYDITRRTTFDSVPRWIHDVKQFGAANVLMALIGNKCDLESKRDVHFEDACKLAEEKEMLAALETSTKQAKSIQDAFILMARELLLRHGMNMKQDDFCNDSSQVILPTNSRAIHDHALFTHEKKTCEC
ncbi:ras-related protein Rab-19-like isoform X2 [Myxocyprinus asiaticus]|uniref:ras-related protein Rab-19-like isoform X2 n=1 Tax=Myxocyprinus asiaticus TaxID=70543 RepID=UPI0022232390|nr:ras-related protein Rab-19-like isoform X2 [Myxocyprinus asiaticus]